MLNFFHTLVGPAENNNEYTMCNNRLQLLSAFYEKGKLYASFIIEQKKLFILFLSLALLSVHVAGKTVRIFVY